MFQYIVRDLATFSNITNAAILYDDSFVMKKNHYDEILSQLPVRHVVNKLKFEARGCFQHMILMYVICFFFAQNYDELKAQILRLTNLELHNFFILGR